MWRGRQQQLAPSSSMPGATRYIMVAPARKLAVRMRCFRPGACMPTSSIARSARSKRFSPLRCAYASRGCMMCPTPRFDKTVDCCSDSWNLHNTAHLLPLRRTNAAASPMCGRWCAASKRPSGYPAVFTTLVRPTIAPLTTPCSKLRVSLPLPGTSKPGHRRLFVPSNNRNATCP